MKQKHKKLRILMLNLRNAHKSISEGPKIPTNEGEFFGYEFPPLGGGKLLIPTLL